MDDIEDELDLADDLESDLEDDPDLTRFLGLVPFFLDFKSSSSELAIEDEEEDIGVEEDLEGEAS